MEPADVNDPRTGNYVPENVVIEAALLCEHASVSSSGEVHLSNAYLSTVALPHVPVLIGVTLFVRVGLLGDEIDAQRVDVVTIVADPDGEVLHQVALRVPIRAQTNPYPPMPVPLNVPIELLFAARKTGTHRVEVGIGGEASWALPLEVVVP